MEEKINIQDIIMKMNELIQKSEDLSFDLLKIVNEMECLELITGESK